VWDTGIGIADEHIKHIFDEFYQVDNPQRDRVQGLGLGLYIVKRSLGLFDGDVCCHSKVGRGTVFEFLVPLTDSLK
jgi:signal transduction histidine kinase